MISPAHPRPGLFSLNRNGEPSGRVVNGGRDEGCQKFTSVEPARRWNSNQPGSVAPTQNRMRAPGHRTTPTDGGPPLASPSYSTPTRPCEAAAAHGRFPAYLPSPTTDEAPVRQLLRLLILPAMACGPEPHSSEAFQDDFARVWCDRQEECALGEFERKYSSGDDCVAEKADDLGIPHWEEGCDPDEEQADACLDYLFETDCAGWDDHHVDDACEDVYRC